MFDYMLEKFKEYLACDTESICIWFNSLNIRWMNQTEITAFAALLALAND